MADFTKVDTSILSVGLLALALIVLITGLLIHSFIIGVNVNDWWKGRSVTCLDHIVSSLGISRMGIQCVITLYLVLATLNLSSVDSDYLLLVSGRVYAFFTYNNIWLTSLLSIVLCLKISNLHTRPLLYLRGMILPRTVHFTVASGVLSVLCCLIHISIADTEMTNNGWHNTTMDNPMMGCIDINTIYSFTIGSSIPMIFYFTSSVLLFFSLYHHTVKMKMNSNLSINLETYYSAMKLVSVTFTYSSIYFIGQFLCGLYFYFYCASPRWIYIVLDFLPALHSLYLIYRTAKLRSQMSNILQNIIDFLFQSRNTKT